MKKRHNIKVLMVAAVLLVAMAGVGLTGAFFSDYEHAAGKAGLSLGGQTSIEEKVHDTEKTIKIKNNGEGDVLVRLSIFGPKPEGDIPGMTITAENGWIEGDDGFWYYQEVLPAGGETSSIIASIKGVPVSVDLSELDIIVVHESQPVVYDADGNADMQWKGAN